MKEKLRSLMEREDLKLSQLAARLEIKSPALSHILSGRNNPGYEMIQKILTKFPQINPDWLLLDSPQMYRQDMQQPAVAPDNASAEPAKELFNRTPDTPQPGPASRDLFSELADDTVNPSRLIRQDKKTAAISRIVIFYDDRTFESFEPSSGR